jgi:hypothetical protein
MTETAADPRVIEIDQFYPHPPQQVWQALTTPELMGPLADGAERVRTGSRYSLHLSGPTDAIGGLFRRDRLRGGRRGGRRTAGDQLG